MPDVIDPSQQHAGAETIELGGSPLLDELDAPPVAAGSKPRGLYPR